MELIDLKEKYIQEHKSDLNRTQDDLKVIINL